MILLPQESYERMFRSRRPVGKPRDRWEDAVWRYTSDLLLILDWKATVTKTGGMRKEIGEATVR
jgi:hypothetical protein